MSYSFSINTYAKINLSLLIYRPRKDGYHPLCSVFQNISTHDTLLVEIKEKPGIELICEHAYVPVNENNILWKIYNALITKNQLSLGLKIKINKNIPIGAGLGGGSSNAAGLLCFLNFFAGLNLSENELIKFGVKYGADIPFFINGGTKLIRGIGEKIYTLPTSSKIKNFVIIYPNIICPTKAVYQYFDRENQNKFRVAGKTPKMIIQNQLGTNDLEPIVFKMIPELKNIHEEITCLTKQSVKMSGSGSTLFIPCANNHDAEQILLKIKKQYPTFFIENCQSMNYGYEIKKL